MAQWLKLHTSIAGGMGLVPGQGPTNCEAWLKVKIKKKKERRRPEWVVSHSLGY